MVKKSIIILKFSEGTFICSQQLQLKYFHYKIALCMCLHVHTSGTHFQNLNEKMEKDKNIEDYHLTRLHN